jgi:hypothetical protein
VRILGARQALKRAPARIRIGGRPPIHLCLERASQAEQHRLFGAPGSGGRHHAGAQFADDLFGDIGMVARARDVERRQREVARFAAVVVTADTVLPYRLRGRVRGGRLFLVRGVRL